MIEIPAAVTVALVAYAVLLAVGAVLLLVGLGDALLAERRVRVARNETIATHYLRVARSH